MTYAVIRIGGRQFKVSEGEEIQLQRQKDGINEVLLFSDGKITEIGTPLLSGYEVILKKVEDKKDRKVRVGRFKGKSRYRRVRGHKQPLSVFLVESVGEKGKKIDKKSETGAQKEESKKEIKEEDKKVKKTTSKRGRPKKKKEE